jgi:SP family sugar:H+ symporter-like MFS transporter
MVGALLAAPIADRVGRKLSISFWAFINMVGIVVQMSTDSKWYQVAMGRWVAGLGIGAISALVPMYQSESAPCHVRGAMVSSFQLCVTLGIFLSYIVNLGTNTIQSTASWRITMGIGFAWSLILGIGTLFLPESPRFAYCRGRFEEARIVMSQLYGVSQNHRVVAQEMQEMEEKFIEEKTTAGPAPWYEVFTGPRMFYRTMLGIVVQSLQQLTGANFLFYYGNSVFSSAGLDNSYVTQVILGAVNFGMTFPGLYMVEHFGRRKCLIYGGLWMFICFMIFASVGHFGLAVNSGSSNPTAGTVMIVFTCFFICGYSTTWGPIVYTICGEMYPARYRAVSIGIATAANWTWNFLISFFTPFITSAIDFRYGYVFGSCCFAGAIIVFFFVNETQGRSLEEIDTMYLSHVKPWKSSSWTAPESAQAQDLQARLEATVSRGEARCETHPPSTPAELSD